MDNNLSDNTDSIRLREANKVEYTTLAANMILSVIKVTVGFLASSAAMIADGIHTVSDVITTVAVIVGMKFSSLPDDEEHPYGHEKIESVVAKMLSLVLMATALFIGYSGIRTILRHQYTRPGIMAVAAAVLSIAVKEIMYRYTIKAADKLNSAALKADAWHHRSDAFSSVGTLIGIAGARIGFPVLDPLAAIVVCFMIIKVGCSIFIQSFNELIDRAADRETNEKMKNTIRQINGVRKIDMLKTRIHGSKIYVDVEIAVDAQCSVKEGHIIAEEVHDNIEESFSNVKHCMVHVNPYTAK